MTALIESVSWGPPGGTPTAAERSPPVRRATRDSSHAAMWARWSLRPHSSLGGLAAASASRPAWSRSSSAQPPSIRSSSCSFVSLPWLIAPTRVTGGHWVAGLRNSGLRALHHQVDQTVGHVDNPPRPASVEQPRHDVGGQRQVHRFALGEPRRRGQTSPYPSVDLDNQGDLILYQQSRIVV